MKEFIIYNKLLSVNAFKLFFIRGNTDEFLEYNFSKLIFYLNRIIG